jgi:hypothetical protein
MRRKHRAQYVAIAKRYTPKGVRVVYVPYKKGRRMIGWAYAGLKEIHVPRPVSSWKLKTYLHEVGHIVLRGTHAPRMMEYDVERSALEVMKKEGIPLPWEARPWRPAYRKAYDAVFGPTNQSV